MDEFDIFGDLTPERKKEKKEKLIHEAEKVKAKEVAKDFFSRIKEEKDFLIYVAVEAILSVIFVLMLIGVLRPF